MINQPPVTRVGFRLQVRPELIDEYRAHHSAVWPEMLDALERCGWHHYSLFLDVDGTLFGYFETTGTLQEAVAAMQDEPVNERWQALMGPYFAVGDAPADQQMRELTEVFHLP
ncbi:MAG TPA: L-rhamnose mutarotase [Ilumatobacteraceae bacterium]